MKPAEVKQLAIAVDQFRRWSIKPRAAKATGEMLKDVMENMHKAVQAREKNKGKPPAGAMRNALSMQQGRMMGYGRPAVEKYLTKLAAAMPELKLTWQPLKRQQGLVPLEIKGIAEEFSPKNIAGGRHTFPPADGLRA